MPYVADVGVQHHYSKDGCCLNEIDWSFLGFNKERTIYVIVQSRSL